MKNKTVYYNGKSPRTFTAIDFETADYGQDSACAVGIVKVEGNKITDKSHYLIRPPRRRFVFTHIHGITWEDVEDAPTFGELWPELRKKLKGADYLVAHNAPFDRSVLAACCSRARIKMPSLPFVCTVKLARKILNINPTNLYNVCKRLRIALNHHNALSDAKACARILIRAWKKDNSAFEELLG